MLSEKPWNRELLLLLVAGLLICWSLGMLLGILVEQFLPVEAVAQKTFYHFVIGTLSFHVAALFLVHQFLKLNGTDWAEFLGLTGPHLRRSIFLAVVAGILVLPVVLALSDWSAWLMNSLGTKPVPQPAIKVLESSVSAGQRVCFGVAALLLAPVAEESLFRGILYPFVKQRGYPRLALWGTSILFGAIHLSLVVFLPLTLLALLFILVYEKTKKLIAPIIMHVLFNAVNFFGAIFAPELDRLWHHLFHR